jgi:hypothetical protein
MHRHLASTICAATFLMLLAGGCSSSNIPTFQGVAGDRISTLEDARQVARHYLDAHQINATLSKGRSGNQGWRFLATPNEIDYAVGGHFFLEVRADGTVTHLSGE